MSQMHKRVEAALELVEDAIPYTNTVEGAIHLEAAHEHLKRAMHSLTKFAHAEEKYAASLFDQEEG